MAQALAGRRLLLILDTYEHVIESLRGWLRCHCRPAQGAHHLYQPRADAGRRRAARGLFPESLWLRDELLLLRAEAGAVDAAEDHFRRALDWARRQGALSWELRAVTSLALLLRDQGHYDDARALLQPVYDSFTEGFETADLKAAQTLLGAPG